MTIRGSVAYEVAAATTELFAAPGAVLTLQNEGPSDVYLSTRDGADTSGSIVLHVNASVPWDADKPCFGRTLTGRATVRATDNSGVITDPSAIATAIIDQGLAEAIAEAINIQVPVSIATALAQSAPTALHVVQFTKVSYTPALIGENHGSFSAYYLDGIQHHYPETLFVDPTAQDFRVLKSLFSMRNNGAGIARVSYAMRRENGAVPDGLFMALNTVRCNPGEVVNFEVEYLREADAATIGGTALFEPLFSIFTDSLTIELDLSFVCGTFGLTVAPPSPNPPPPHPITTLVQTATPVQWPNSSAPAPAKSVVFANPVAVGDVIAMAIAFRVGDVDYVNGCGSSAWNIIKSRDAASGYTTVIAWTRATAAGSSATVNFTAGSSLGQGSATAWQLHGVTAAILSGTMPNKVASANPATPSLDSTDLNQVYIGVTVHAAGGGPSGYTEVPGAFTAVYDADSTGNDNWIHAGLRISNSISATSRTTHWAGAVETISVSALFT